MNVTGDWAMIDIDSRENFEQYTARVANALIAAGAVPEDRRGDIKTIYLGMVVNEETHATAMGGIFGTATLMRWKLSEGEGAGAPPQ